MNAGCDAQSNLRASSRGLAPVALAGGEGARGDEWRADDANGQGSAAQQTLVFKVACELALAENPHGDQNFTERALLCALHVESTLQLFVREQPPLA